MHGNKGRKFSEEHKRKIGDANKISRLGLKDSPETRKKKSLAAKGKKKSPEHIKKVVEARMKSCGCGWKGELAGKEAMHKWVEKIKGKPMKCDFCGDESKKRYYWSNKYHTYKRILEDYQRLCAKCHTKYDIENNNKPNNYKVN